MGYEDPAYQAGHRLIRKVRGKAKEHRCVDCGEQAYDWSQRKETDVMLPESYDPRCRSCHQLYDVTDAKRERTREALRGYVHSEESKENMSLAHAFGDGTTCAKGHDLTNPRNVRPGRGPRSCAECNRESARRSKQKKKVT